MYLSVCLNHVHCSNQLYAHVHEVPRFNNVGPFSSNEEIFDLVCEYVPNVC